MPLFGVGTDIVEIKRIERAAGERFLKRYFTEDENKLFASNGHRPQTVAANFAAKEAFVKALGTGFFGIAPADIEVLRDEKGKPVINVFRGAEAAVCENSIKHIHVSLTHEKNYALAFVVLET